MSRNSKSMEVSRQFLQNQQSFIYFFPFFVLVYLISYFLLFRTWNPKIRPEASSCIISLFHGMPAVLMAAHAILTDPSRGFPSPNTRTQDGVLEYSIAYFTTDLLHYLLFYPQDVLFIAHHLATLFVFLTCRYLVHGGAFGILCLLILAEITSACQNLWTLAGLKRTENGYARKVFDVLSVPFYSLYSVVRGFIGPYFMYRMGFYFLNEDDNGLIPKWIWVSWIFVIMTAICVSILWVSNLWVELYREKCGDGKKER